MSALRLGRLPAGPVRLDAPQLQSSRRALLLVPSVIAPEEYCVLVNPAYLDATEMRATVLRPMEYYTLFR